MSIATSALKALAWSIPTSAALVFMYGLYTFDYEENYSHDPQYEFSASGFVVLTLVLVGVSLWYQLADRRRKNNESTNGRSSA